MAKTYVPKEISWLSFNERVLQEAGNHDNPLLERFKFLGIYSNNLDEYFRVRIATLKRLSKIGPRSKNILGYDPRATLKKIQKIVLDQNSSFEKIYSDLIIDLEKHKIHFVNENQLNAEQARFVQQYFQKEVRSRLMPFLVSRDSELPNLTDDAIYLAITLLRKSTGKKRFALLEIPSDVLPRFLVLPESGDDKFVMFLDDVVRFGLKDIFFLFDFDEISAYTIKLTKDAELDIADDILESYIDKISRSLQQRKWGSPTRFIYDKEIPADLLRILIKRFNFGPEDVTVPAERYHNFKDFMKFPNLGKKKLYFEPWIPVSHPDIPHGKSILSSINKKDIMLFFPYHPFDHFLDLLREASIDPNVTAIHITLYRLARNSSVINALFNAARNGKEVTTLVELQARFDEEANILWSNKLMDEGVKVIYGVPGLKVHSKLCLITRVKNESVSRYAAVGTGNFNEETAKLYTDHLLLTSDKKITNEVYKTFSFFDANYRKDNFYHLVLSPFNLRNRLISLIENEIRNARDGKKAFIYMKLNNLTDVGVIDQLYEASRAGVNVKLIIRGMMSLVTGVKGLSENIKAIGIVDRFLEHTRFIIFHNGGNEECFISSADLMTRNIEHRVEVVCPVFNPDLRNELKDIFDIQWKDNVKARRLDATLSNEFVRKGRKDKKEIRSQTEILEYIRKKSSAEVK